MKNLKLFTAILVVLITIPFTNCTPEQDFGLSSKEIISQGKWSVDYYYAGQNKTAQYSSYRFIFNGNGTVSCEQAGVNYTGSWSMIKDVNRNDVLLMQMNSSQPDLSELNVHWTVNSISNSLVDMKDDSSTEFRLRKL
jgi:hypothetical protein